MSFEMRIIETREYYTSESDILDVMTAVQPELSETYIVPANQM